MSETESQSERKPLDELTDEYLDHISVRKADSTADRWGYNVDHFMEWDGAAHPDELTTMEVENFLYYLLDDGYHDTSVRSAYWTVKSFFDYLTETGQAETNPAEEVDLNEIAGKKSKKGTELKSKGDVVYVKPDEVKEMLKYAGHAVGSEVRNRLVLKLLFQTGVRRIELCRMKVNDIDRDERSIKVLTAKQKHDDETRTVWYRQDMESELSTWLDRGRRKALPTAHESPYLFPTKKNEQMSPVTCSQIVREVADAADVQEYAYTDNGGQKHSRISCHAFRHGCAVTLLKNNCDITFIKEILGHSDLDVTKQYLQVVDDDVRDAYRDKGTDLALN